MSEPVISVENLSKRYVIGHQRDSRDGLRHAVENAMRHPLRWFLRRKRQNRNGLEEFWALKDVSFKVQQGDVVGFIGRNGAGKSTLLKILSRITEPTSGRIEINGRVSSLLEVGTGFHHELTGRENIFLNGAILGMSKGEIKRKFDEIVTFSEIEKFLDTPVKRYSSGMYVRLAFAVAAHLEPEILIVDEVLAVGDAEFQKKCLGKMSEVSRGGRTVLFVSHNIGAVRALCNKGVLLKGGKMVMMDSIDSVATAYAQDSSGSVAKHSVHLEKPAGTCDLWMESVQLLCNGQPGSYVEMGDELEFAVKFRSKKPIAKPMVGYLIRTARGENVVNANNHFLPSCGYAKPVTEGTIVCNLGALPLMAGSYSVSFWLNYNPHEHQHLEDVLHFEVAEKDIWGNGQLPTKSLSCLWWPTRFEFEVNKCTPEPMLINY
jgi:lipopolysaccharide transport system ATP-binding protein